MLAIGISTAILAIVATIAPLVLSNLGFINEDFGKLVSVTMIIGMYVRGIVNYFKEALTTVDHILANQDFVEQLQATPEEESQPESKLVE